MLDHGVKLINTAARSGTEEIVGEAIAAVPRDSFFISNKARAHEGRAYDSLPPADLVDSREASLRRLGTDAIDEFQHYKHVREAVVPAILTEKGKGKFRHLGITEYGSVDTGQTMQAHAGEGDCWDVIMVAFHIKTRNRASTSSPTTSARALAR